MPCLPYSELKILRNSPICKCLPDPDTEIQAQSNVPELQDSLRPLLFSSSQPASSSDLALFFYILREIPLQWEVLWPFLETVLLCPLSPPPPPPTHHFVGGPSPSPWPVCGSPTWLSALFFYLRVDRSRFASSALFPSPPPTHHFGGGPSPSSCPVCGSPTWLSALFFYLRVGRSRFSRRRLSFPPPLHPSPLTSHLERFSPVLNMAKNSALTSMPATSSSSADRASQASSLARQIAELWRRWLRIRPAERVSSSPEATECSRQALQAQEKLVDICRQE